MRAPDTHEKLRLRVAIRLAQLQQERAKNRAKGEADKVLKQEIARLGLKGEE
jgi:hypothetical protein